MAFIILDSGIRCTSSCLRSAIVFAGYIYANGLAKEREGGRRKQKKALLRRMGGRLFELFFLLPLAGVIILIRQSCRRKATNNNARGVGNRYAECSGVELVVFFLPRR